MAIYAYIWLYIYIYIYILAGVILFDPSSEHFNSQCWSFRLQHPLCWLFVWNRSYGNVPTGHGIILCFQWEVGFDFCAAQIQFFWENTIILSLGRRHWLGCSKLPRSPKVDAAGATADHRPATDCPPTGRCPWASWVLPGPIWSHLD